MNRHTLHDPATIAKVRIQLRGMGMEKLLDWIMRWYPREARWRKESFGAALKGVAKQVLKDAGLEVCPTCNQRLKADHFPDADKKVEKQEDYGVEAEDFHFDNKRAEENLKWLREKEAAEQKEPRYEQSDEEKAEIMEELATAESKPKFDMPDDVPF